MQQVPALTPQQEAIKELHGRYERGELSFEEFERALDRVLQAQSAEECWAILQKLPASSPMSINALEIPSAAVRAPVPPSLSIFSLIGEVKRIRHPWRLGRQTSAFMLIGEMELDLSLAALPQQGDLYVNVGIGEVKIYVPRSVHASVHATAVIGEVKVFGEKAEGIGAHSSGESRAQDTYGYETPHINIHVNLLIGEVKVVQVDNPVITQEALSKSKRGQLPQPK